MQTALFQCLSIVPFEYVTLVEYPRSMRKILCSGQVGTFILLNPYRINRSGEQASSAKSYFIDDLEQQLPGIEQIQEVFRLRLRLGSPRSDIRYSSLPNPVEDHRKGMPWAKGRR